MFFVYHILISTKKIGQQYYVFAYGVEIISDGMNLPIKDNTITN